MSNAVLNRERKHRMIEHTKELFSKHQNYMLVSIHKVQSTQFKNISSKLPSNMKILFAKNKIMKKVLRELDEKKYEDLINSIKGNVLIIFFDGEDPATVMNISSKNMRKAFAVPGDVARSPVVVPAGPTGLAPEKINFFQAAHIQTKITKGKIDVASEHVLVPAGEPVGILDANILRMLNIMPFEFGADIIKVYEGSESYPKEVLLIDEACIEESVKSVVSEIAAISLGSGIVTEASLTYEIAGAYTDIKKIMLGLGMDLAK